MIRVSDIKCKPEEKDVSLRDWSAGALHIPAQDILSVRLVRESIDARKKPQVFLCRTMDMELKKEEQYCRAFQKRKISYTITKKKEYPYPHYHPDDEKIVVTGAGPAGLFCAYFLCLAGKKVTLLERGKPVEERAEDVKRFWESGKLLSQSNVSFGEGGAGTFSDGKLNTLVKDKSGRNQAVLETLVKFGAPENILYEAKPHLGTDVLMDVVKNMRLFLQEAGVCVRFSSQMTDILLRENAVVGVTLASGEEIPCEKLVLAVGHSARDTFQMLYDRRLPMEQKAFAVGFRMEHLQEMINLSQYGEKYAGMLPPAAYKVTAGTGTGRSVYSFCMCPGGYVVNASTEEGMLAVNGMSYSRRDGANANSAIVVNVTPKDFAGSHVLAGVEFQRKLEKKAYELGQGRIPCQYYADFKAQTANMPVQEREGAFTPCTKGAYRFTSLKDILPAELEQALVEGIEAFGRQIKGFDRPDAILLGVESRTSSPIRMVRGENLESGLKGIYPCGEGAGYAGGIMSAAMDGIKVAEAILGNPFLALTECER